MSLIHVQQIRSNLHSTFDALIDLSDYAGRPDPEREAVFLTRALAAFAVMHMANASATDAAQAVTDGGQDNGVDALFYDEAERILYVVQSKWQHEGRGSVERGDVQKFIKGFKDLMYPRFERFNAKVQAKRPTVDKAIKSADSRFVLVLAYNGQEPLAVEQQRDFGDLLEEMNDTSDLLSLQTLRQTNIHKIIASGAKGTPVSLEVVIQDWGQTKDPYSSYFGRVAASEVACWYEHHHRLFMPNIRTFLGHTEVNRALMETLRNSPDKFWYFNNGVTVLCASIRKKPIGGNSRESGCFECTDVTIVNGAQTVGAIAQANDANPESVAKASVLVRFISLENCPDEFGAQVTRATNTQNRVERRDFVSFDAEQERIQTELRLETIQYVYKPGDRVSDLTQGFDFDEAIVAQACSRPEIGLAVTAKREVSKLWDDITKWPYKVLFNESVVATELWYKVRILREIESRLGKIREVGSGRDGLFPTHGNRLIAHHVFMRLSHEGLDKPNGHKVEDVLARVQEITPSIVGLLTKAANDMFPESYLAVLFKNESKCKQISDLMTSHTDTP